jgi:SpoIID/LytB domain protein
LRSDIFNCEEYLQEKRDIPGKTMEQYQQEEEQWFSETPESFCASSKSSFRWQRIYDQEDFQLIFGYPLADLQQIIPLEKGECFHYKSVRVVRAKDDKILNSDLAIRDYFDKLRSSAFRVERKFSLSQPTFLIFYGAGFGHGAGMCQEGAAAMAAKGYTYQQILEHYYPQSKISLLNKDF